MSMHLLDQKPLAVKKTKKPPIGKRELNRLHKLLHYEEAARKQGFRMIAGIDEAGRGPLAGPVVAAACIIPQDLFIAGINDSKQLEAEERCDLYEKLIADSRIQYAIGIVSHEIIDKINIYQATLQAMLEAVAKLVLQPDMLLVDGLHLPHFNIPCTKIIQGDCKSYSIAAASIIAKETRDRLMVAFHDQWPHYGFDRHKGYATPFHKIAIKAHGPSPIHRLSFEPLKSLFGRKEEEQLSLF
jgi:ribonuclease HII